MTLPHNQARPILRVQLDRKPIKVETGMLAEIVVDVLASMIGIAEDENG